VRIGGGTANRRTLRTVAGRRVRPTSGRVRQALWNILREQIADAVFVDLFAGTGSVGLEALSHGARQAYFVEHDRRALQVLRANIRRCAMDARATVISGSLPRALKYLPVHLQADILFLDPPYASQLAEQTLQAVAASTLLAPHGIVVWQHAARHLAPPVLLGLSLWQRRCYGDTHVSFYTWCAHAEGG
jgi:16S rRNA (guanine(966)-N(2))-methyltransferase RsmD